MKLRLKKTPDQVKLITAMGSKDPAVSRPAIEAFAAILPQIVEKVLLNAGTVSMLYRDLPYNEDDSPSFPVDLWYNEDENYITVWYQTVAGGLPTSVVEGNAEMKFHTYRLDSAVAVDKKYARKANLDVMAKMIERMAQEVLVKQERNGWAVILKALAEASTNGLAHVIDSVTNDVFQVQDFNALLTRARRINTSWNKGTPVAFDSKGVTDLFVSPEMKEQIRGFAFQPMNTRASVEAGTASNVYGPAIALPDSVREEIFRSAGAQEIYGIAITELLELGTGQKYNALFDTFYTGSFTPASEEIIIGVDLSREGALRPVETSGENQATFSAQPDDQFVSRQDKVGFWGYVHEGRAVIDSRVYTGIIV